MLGFQGTQFNPDIGDLRTGGKAGSMDHSSGVGPNYFGSRDSAGRTRRLCTSARAEGRGCVDPQVGAVGRLSGRPVPSSRSTPAGRPARELGPPSEGRSCLEGLYSGTRLNLGFKKFPHTWSVIHSLDKYLLIGSFLGFWSPSGMDTVKVTQLGDLGPLISPLRGLIPLLWNEDLPPSKGPGRMRGLQCSHVSSLLATIMKVKGRRRTEVRKGGKDR